MDRVYVGARQLFGFVTPGLMWVTLGLLAVGENPAALLSRASGWEIVGVGTVAFVIGMVGGTMSFRVACRLSGRVHGDTVVGFFPGGLSESLLREARQAMQHHFGPSRVPWNGWTMRASARTARCTCLRLRPRSGAGHRVRDRSESARRAPGSPSPCCRSRCSCTPSFGRTTRWRTQLPLASSRHGRCVGVLRGWAVPAASVATGGASGMVTDVHDGYAVRSAVDERRTDPVAGVIRRRPIPRVQTRDADGVTAGEWRKAACPPR